MKNISAKYIGLITGGLMVLTSLIMFYQFHFPDTGTVNYVRFTIYTIGIIFTLLIYNGNNVDQKKMKDYFSEGFKTFVIVVLIMALFTIVFYKLNPQIFESKLLLINKYNALDTSKTPAEVIENGNKLKSVFLPMTVATTTILYLVIGTLVSLIGAGFLSQQNIKKY